MRMDSRPITSGRAPLFPVRLNQRHRWLLNQLATKAGHTRGGLIKLWIDREAKKMGLVAPRELTPIEPIEQ